MDHKPRTLRTAGEILQEARRHMNGEVAARLRSQGIGYAYSLGVPVSELVRIARGVEPRMEVARELIGRQLREAILLASMVADTSRFETTDYPLWEATLTNPETVDIASFYCLSHTSGILDRIGVWLGYSSDPMRIHAAMACLTHLLKRGGDLSPVQIDRLHLEPMLGHSALSQVLLRLLTTARERSPQLYARLAERIGTLGSESERALLTYLDDWPEGKGQPETNELQA